MKKHAEELKTAFDEADKAKYRDEHFAKDLENAYELGRKLLKQG